MICIAAKQRSYPLQVASQVSTCKVPCASNLVPRSDAFCQASAKVSAQCTTLLGGSWGPLGGRGEGVSAPYPPPPYPSRGPYEWMVPGSMLLAMGIIGEPETLNRFPGLAVVF